MGTKSDPYIRLMFFSPFFFVCFTDDPVVIGVVPSSGQRHCFLGNEAAGKLKEMCDFAPPVAAFAIVFCMCVGECMGDHMGEREMD